MVLTPAIELEAVTARYDGYEALHDVNLRIARGALVAIVGPSGAGKTTLLRLVLGLLQPFGGTIRVLGEPPQGVRKRIRYVPQLETIDWTFPVTVEQVVGMGFLSRKLPWLSASQRRRISEVLERLGIGGLEKRHILNLSGGQQQRVFLARALVEEPELLILDEPTASTDVGTRSDILGLLEDINDSGITVVLTTHDINLIANRVGEVVLFNRTVKAHGRPADVLTSALLSETFSRPILSFEHEGKILVAEIPQEADHRHHIHVHHDHAEAAGDAG